MLIFRDPVKFQKWALKQRSAGVKIGLVPTMGFLHEGHLSLIDIARRKSDAVAVSIFVNPIQFGPGEDYAVYPRDEKADLAKCRAAGAAAVFLPTPETMYAPDASVTVEESVLSDRLCGLRRPGHFRGVCTVVAKLFNLALPEIAVFGRKDFQQAAIIKRMVRDLNFPVKIITAPIVREADGLAKSSRNTYLKPEERKRAVGLYEAICFARESVASGPVSASALRRKITSRLEKQGLRVDYVELLDPDRLDPVRKAEIGTVLLLAVFNGTTRLIDNASL